MIFKIIKGAFDHLTETQQTLLMSNMRRTARAQKSMLSRKSNPEKIEYIKNLVIEIFTEVKYSSILMFNAIFEEGDIHRALSNTPVSNIMNFIIEDLNILDKIF